MRSIQVLVFATGVLVDGNVGVHRMVTKRLLSR